MIKNSSKEEKKGDLRGITNFLLSITDGRAAWQKY